MEQHGVPCRIIAPGRVYRCDHAQTSTTMFHQCGGRAIDRDIPMAKLRVGLGAFGRAFLRAGGGVWKGAAKKQQDKHTSDGYGTGFIVYVLRRAVVSAGDPRIEKAIVWLKKNQRQSGRWFTRSLNKDNHHCISHAGSAFALMALAECGQIGK